MIYIQRLFTRPETQIFYKFSLSDKEIKLSLQYQPIKFKR